MNFEKILEFRNKTNAFANLIGLSVTEIDTGYAKAQMAINKDMLNPIGSVHGGVLFTIADVTGGYAACSHGYAITTMDSSFHFLRPGINTQSIYSTAREVKHGKNVSVYDVSVFDQDDTLLAEGMFTYMSLGEKIPEAWED